MTDTRPADPLTEEPRCDFDCWMCNPTDAARAPRSDDALRAALVEAINDAADLRLPDGTLAIGRAHAVAVIQNTALATSAPPSPDVEGLRAMAADHEGHTLRWVFDDPGDDEFVPLGTALICEDEECDPLIVLPPEYAALRESGS